VGGQLVRFLCEHMGNPIPSVVISERTVSASPPMCSGRPAKNPMIRSGNGGREIERMTPIVARATSPGWGDRRGAAVPMGRDQLQPANSMPRSAPGFGVQRAPRRVSVYSIVVVDPDWGSGLTKICTFSSPIWRWLNGHAWARCQAARHGVELAELVNASASCGDPVASRAIRDLLGRDDVHAFFDRWIAVIPTPSSAADYWWEPSRRQAELSRTLVFETPRAAPLRSSTRSSPTTGISAAPARGS
jgi:hypothetical protein